MEGRLLISITNVLAWYRFLLAFEQIDGMIVRSAKLSMMIFSDIFWKSFVIIFLIHSVDSSPGALFRLQIYVDIF